MQEYLATLAQEASEGDTQAAEKLRQTQEYIKQQNQALEGMANRLAEQGATVTRSGNEITITFD